MAGEKKATRLTLEQRRARNAWEKAEKGYGEHGGDYVNAAKGLPALIMSSGLMQVMAFCRDKGRHHETLAGHLRAWLHEACGTPEEFEAFMEAMLATDSRTFQAVNSEAFAWLKWLRQLAAARQGGE